MDGFRRLSPKEWRKVSTCLLPVHRIHTSVRSCGSTQRWCGASGAETMAEKLAVLFVCLGNICRSPLAEAAFRRELIAVGLEAEIDSAGTGDWHIGEAPDRRAQAVAKQQWPRHQRLPRTAYHAGGFPALQPYRGTRPQESRGA